MTVFPTVLPPAVSFPVGPRSPSELGVRLSCLPEMFTLVVHRRDLAASWRYNLVPYNEQAS